MKEFSIHADEAGQRLDKYLKKLLPEASAGFIYKMLRKKNITYNDRKAAGNELLQPLASVKLFSAMIHLTGLPVNLKQFRKNMKCLKTCR